MPRPVLRPALALLLLALAAPALAGDAPDAAALARDYVSREAAERTAAERVVATAPADLLRSVLLALRSEMDRAHDRTPVRPETASADAPIVEVEVRFLDATLPAARALSLVDARGDVPVRGLTRQEVGAVLAAVEREQDVTLVASPRMAVHDRQRADVTVTNQTAYVEDLEVRTGADGSRIADPVIGTITTGVELVVVPRVVPDGSEVLLDVDLQLSELAKPMAEHVIAVGGTHVRLQMPEIRHGRLQRRVVVADGGTVVVGAWGRLAHAEPAGGAAAEPRAAEVERRVIALLTVRLP